jgi:ABC-type sugar transport system ATPase subunit
LGERSILEIKSGETSFKVLTDPQKNIKKGDSLKIYYKKENVMIFHPETEELIEKAS